MDWTREILRGAQPTLQKQFRFPLSWWLMEGDMGASVAADDEEVDLGGTKRFNRAK